MTMRLPRRAPRDAPAGGRRERWIDGAQQKGARDAHALETRLHDPRREGFDVDRDIGQLRHLGILGDQRNPLRSPKEAPMAVKDVVLDLAIRYGFR